MENNNTFKTKQEIVKDWLPRYTKTPLEEFGKWVLLTNFQDYVDNFAKQFDVEDRIVKKCNMCVDEIDAGRKPYCVMACMMRVLDIGPIDKLQEGTHETKAVGINDKVVRQVKNFASPDLTNPSIRFVPHSKGKVK